MSFARDPGEGGQADPGDLGVGAVLPQWKRGGGEKKRGSRMRAGSRGSERERTKRLRAACSGWWWIRAMTTSEAEEEEDEARFPNERWRWRQ